ncbi:hypothetical protein N0V93_007182 [Gnomoniopsis smithogilvyi]|uniref:Small secreted protein n=1 Tax=Gnomoniopsis smithogilvyi TaxID=1191159 RepID=A0A9W8YQ14_9PEZI|nr:hypothetical protein N0V93_007182 [Gnomoniopsis smithogilvyi]
MKYAAALTLALAAMALAKPMPAKGAKAAANANANGKANGNAAAAANAQQVQDNVNQWLQDIKDVNTFVDTALNLKSAQDISDAASTAFVAAQDEGTQNDNLAAAVQLDSLGALANKDLANQFGIIGPAINDTIFNPQNLQKNLDAINGARCPPPVGDGAILEEGAVQQAAAQAVGAVADAPEIPQACNA